MCWQARTRGRAAAHLAVEEHVLADGEAQLVARGLQRKSEQPRVVAQLDLLRQRERYLLLGVQCDQVCFAGCPCLLLLRSNTHPYQAPHKQCNHSCTLLLKITICLYPHMLIRKTLTRDQMSFTHLHSFQ